MAIKRVFNARLGFTMVFNDIFHCEDISYRAKGIYCQMWSLPESWVITSAGMVSMSTEGRDAVASALKELEEAGFLKRAKAREVNGSFAGWDYELFQTPEPENPTSVNPQLSNTIDNNISKSIESNGDTKDTTRTRAKRFVVPTLAEVQAYCTERRNRVDPQYFIDFYASKGWKVGKDPMVDWKASVRTWERKDKDSRAAAPQRVGNPVDYDS